MVQQLEANELILLYSHSLNKKEQCRKTIEELTPRLRRLLDAVEANIDQVLFHDGDFYSMKSGEGKKRLCSMTELTQLPKFTIDHHKLLMEIPDLERQLKELGLENLVQGR